MLKDKVAVVTGSSRGIGRAIALALAEEGCHVVINYVGCEAQAKSLAAEIEARERQALVVRADVSDRNEAGRLVDSALQAFGRIDILVNNAGITRDNLLLRMSPQDWDAVIQTNLTGVFNCTKLALKPMLKQRWGRIINIASVSGIAGNPGQANYAAAKAGIIAFTKSVAKEVASRNILVNAIAPGFIATDMTGKLLQENEEKLLASIPVGRLGRPEEIAGVAVFLASEKANYITGQTIVVDGGLTI
ncbi:MAG TPA: 3-oxoacyl-[acyl-carrier-protein] reductase [Clostridia bacterium]|nr:3-oxoacyl-[acyl-carrier-protein] reductase [Clostridia bacterium]